MSSNTITLEVGKFYQTRDGNKLRVYAVDGVSPRKVHAAYQVKDGTGEWVSTCYTTDGCYYDVNNPRHLDVVAEWVDPPEFDWSKEAAWINYVAMDSSGRWYGFSHEPLRDHSVWYLSDVHTKDVMNSSVHRIPKDHSPKFAGRFEDSMIVRPK